MGIHNGTTRGKRVYVKLKNGETFVDKYLDTNSMGIRFENRGIIPKSAIVTFSIYRSHEPGH